VYKKISEIPSVVVCCLLLICTISCNYKQENYDLTRTREFPYFAHTKKLTIVLQPFANFTQADLVFVTTQLRKIYPKIRVKKAINLPLAAYTSARKRYRADSLVNFLDRKTEEGFVSVGLTRKDISYTKGKAKDFGIMGLYISPGNACLVSTFRLKGANRKEKLFKVVIHELGHTQGLPHCPVQTCFMRDAEGKDSLNEEHAFCPKCKQVMKNAGWKLN
jgi:archaemetzincin